MRTTLDIEDDVLQAAKELARREGSTAGRILSRLARQGLSSTAQTSPQRLRSGVPVIPSRGDIITIERIQKLMDEEGV